MATPWYSWQYQNYKFDGLTELPHALDRRATV
jgi:hypothetical protein